MNRTFSRSSQIASLQTRGWNIYTFKTCSLVVAVQTQTDGRVWLKSWTGKRNKTDNFVTLRNIAFAEEQVGYWEKMAIKQEARRAERTTEKAAARKTLKASDHYSVGDVIYNSWGYDQTNVDFYEVTAVLEKSVKIREIGENKSVTGFMQGMTQPVRGQFIGEEMTKVVSTDGRIGFDHGGASKWNGKAVGWTAYA